jgi:hypothetical protein
MYWLVKCIYQKVVVTNADYPGILIRIQSTKCYNVIADQDPRGSYYSQEKIKQIYYRQPQQNGTRYYKWMASIAE